MLVIFLKMKVAFLASSFSWVRLQPPVCDAFVKCEDLFPAAHLDGDVFVFFGLSQAVVPGRQDLLFEPCCIKQVGRSPNVSRMRP